MRKTGRVFDASMIDTPWSGTGDDRAESRRRFERLTPAEREVARLISMGLSNEQIAFVAGWKTASARRYVSRILDKSGLADRTQIAINWLKAGYD